MKRNNVTRVIIVALVLLWALIEAYPPTSRDLVQVFRSHAIVPPNEPGFSNILARLDVLQKTNPGESYNNLVAAIGTNDISKYFPYSDATNQVDPNTYVLNELQRAAAGRIRLGIDLQGGTSFLLRMETNKFQSSAGGMSTALNEAVEVVRKRVDRFGVAEPVIQPEGADRILVQLPGLSDLAIQEAKQQVTNAAYLEFRMVNPDGAKLIHDGMRNEPGYTVMKMKLHKQPGETDARVVEEMVTSKPYKGFTGSYIETARVGRGEIGQAEIEFTLNNEGASLFQQITSENIGKQLAIVLDGNLISAPTIQSTISKNGQITGDFTDEEASELANALQNPLRAPLILEEEHTVGPSLGAAAIHSGMRAAVYGTLAVSIFMLVYYMVAGMIANVALIANIIILIGVMCSIQTTLTLPGIAGVVLTVGMAVDANVLIYERIREESAKGKSIRGAINAGYDRAFSTIFDSHVTTLISSIILIFKGTGSIKGFGVALTIGVGASLFTALIVTRLIFDFLLDRNWLKQVHMLHIIRATSLDFMKLAKIAFALSWLLIIVGVGYGGYRGFVKHNLLGIDFAGGDMTTFEFKQMVDIKDVTSAISKAGISDFVPQYQKESSTGRETLRVDSPIGTADRVKAALAQFQTPSAGGEVEANKSRENFHVVGQDKIGAIVGREIQRSAVVASLLSLFGILVYVAFRYEFSFAVGAVLAVIHDVLMTIGCYCLTGLFAHGQDPGRQFNATFVAALLTIIGFSVNDTIVIFDRIREDLKLGIRGTFREVMNKALNQTLSRTLITSGTVFLSTLSLYIFGGGAINDFAFTFLIGIITGTYSSIYIASALVLWWHRGERPKIGASQQVTMETVEGVRGAA